MRCDLNENTDSISSDNSHLTIDWSAYHINTVQNKILALLTSFSLQQKVVDRDVQLLELVEHCTGIAKVKGSNPVQPWIFF